MLVTVIFPVVVDTDKYTLDIDQKRIDDCDYDYIEEIKDDIKSIACDVIQNDTIKPIIQSCEECQVLVD